MDQGPLVTEQIDAAARFLGEFQKCYPVQAAFWVKDSDDGNWRLFVASDQITDDNFDVAYGEVGRVACDLNDPCFDMFQVKVVGVDDPLAQVALAIRRRYPGRSPTWFNGNTFNGLGVEQAYVYPSPLPVPAS